MKNIIFNGESRMGVFMFGKMLSWLDAPSRNRFGDAETLVEASGIQPGQRVLEIGCGSGYFTPAIAEKTGENGFTEAVDLHPSAVEATREKAAQMNIQNIRVSRADAHETDFADGAFDVIILYGIVPAPVISESRLAAELYRLLKNSGTLAIWTLTPLWTPKRFLKNALFVSGGIKGGVHLLQKKEV